MYIPIKKPLPRQINVLDRGNGGYPDYQNIVLAPTKTHMKCTPSMPKLQG